MRSTEQARRGRFFGLLLSAKSFAPPSKLGGGVSSALLLVQNHSLHRASSAGAVLPRCCSAKSFAPPSKLSGGVLPPCCRSAESCAPPSKVGGGGSSCATRRKKEKKRRDVQQESWPNKHNTRKPRLSTRVTGPSRSRKEQRQSLDRPRQPPPRTTRRSTSFGPVGIALSSGSYSPYQSAHHSQTLPAMSYNPSGDAPLG
jgi:hypothetical protein